MPTSPTLQGLNCDTGEALGMDKGVLEGEAVPPRPGSFPGDSHPAVGQGAEPPLRLSWALPWEGELTAH